MPRRLLLFMVAVGTALTQSSRLGYDCDDEKARGVYYECIRCNLREIPADIPEDTECLVLSGNKISGLKPDELSRLTRLRKLWIHDNWIFDPSTMYKNQDVEKLEALHLVEGTLDKSPKQLFMPRLHTLDIRGNRVRDVLEMNYTGLPRLLVLDVSYNYIWGALTSEKLQTLPRNLERISMTAVGMSSADRAFTQFSKLEYLNVGNNYNLQRFPRGLPPSLRQLSVLGNNIRRISSATFRDISHLKKLTHLAVQGYDDVFADAFRDLDTVTHLTLRTCRVHAYALRGMKRLQELRMPVACRKHGGGLRLDTSAFQEIPRVDTISITRSDLEAIPDGAFAGLRTLRHLDVSNNKITDINSNALDGITSLQSLDLEYNKLEEIPHFLPKSLKELKLKGNAFRELVGGSIPQLPGLINMTISADLIHKDSFLAVPNVYNFQVRTCDIRSYAFRGLHRVKEFIMNNNCRRNDQLRLESHAFSGLEDLYTLELKSNRIASVPQYAFTGLTNLHKLDLSGNFYIEEIHPTVLEGCFRLEELWLQSNRLAGVPQGLPPSLVFLNLDYNNIQEINNNSFPPLPRLQTLIIRTEAIQTDSFRNIPRLSSFQIKTCFIGSYAFRGLSIQHLPLGSTCPWNPKSLKISSYSFSGLDHVESIDLVRNSIGTIPANAFHGLANLKHLDMASNVISIVDENAFSGLPNIEYLSLYANRITEVPTNIPLTLTHLNLGINSIVELNSSSLPPLNYLVELHIRADTLNEDAFYNVRHINKLNVKTCNVRANAFRGLTNITSLDLAHACSGIRSFEIESGGFAGLTSISTISFSNNRIRSLPSQAFPNLWSLRVLKLDNNWINSIDPNAFVGSDQLETLYLNNNRLAGPPLNLPLFLKELDLTYNSISNLTSDSLSSLPNLTELNISATTLQRDAFKNTPRITKLGIRTGNINSYAFESLKELPDFKMEFVSYSGGLNLSEYAFAGMDSLQSVTIRMCGIRQLKPKVFADLRKLEYIDLSMNYIPSIPAGIIDNCVSLREFRIRRTYASQAEVHITEGIFNTAGLESLETIHLEYFRVVSVAPLAFTNLPSLRVLHLGNNILSNLTPEVLQNAPGIVATSMAGNRWHCDCRLRWMKELLDSGDVIFDDSENTRCTTPAAVAGQKFSDLTPNQFACLNLYVQ